MPATKTKPTARQSHAKKTPESLSVEELVEKMDKLLPKWKLYETDRKAKVARERRRGLKEHQEFEKLYSTLRARGLKLADARKQVAAK